MDHWFELDAPKAVKAFISVVEKSGNSQTNDSRSIDSISIGITHFIIY